ncbi:MAG: hypothetical protein Q8O51_01635 [bacterium]|nr:hypothetical protein [bacterium]
MSEIVQLTEEQQEFVDKIAQSLGAKNADDLARMLEWAEGGKAFEDAQAMADHFGFKSIYTYFSSPDNDRRYLEIEMALFEEKRRLELQNTRST